MAISDSAIKVLLGAVFVLAFLTMHISLVPLTDAEYQPILFIVLGAVVAIAGYRDVSFLGPAVVLFGVIAAGALHASQGTLQPQALVRCAVGPFFAAVGPLLVRYIPRSALAAIVYVHAFIALSGLIAGELTTGALQLLGLRGAQNGWNTFMASEPSYAALNLVSVVALLSLKDKTILSGHLGLLSGLVLFATMSLTGTFFGLVLVLVWMLTSPELGSGTRKLAGIAVAAFVLVLLTLVGGEQLLHVASRLQLIMDSLVARDVLGLFAGEQSGAWRFLSNGLAFIGISYAPLGTGGLTLDVAFQQNAEGIASSLIGVILASEVYAGLQANFVASTPFFNYMTFGGLLAVIPLSGFVLLSGIRVYRGPYAPSVKTVFMCCVACGLIWQTALTSPGWWFLIGAGFQFSRSVAKGAIRRSVQVS